MQESSVDLCFESSWRLHQAIRVSAEHGLFPLCGGVCRWDMCLLTLYCTTSRSHTNTTCKGDRRFLLKSKRRVYSPKSKLFKEIPEEKQSVIPHHSYPLLRCLNNWGGSQNGNTKPNLEQEGILYIWQACYLWETAGEKALSHGVVVD